MPDPLAFEPLSDAADPWVMALTRLEEKILNPDLSFYKYCVSAFEKAPTVFAHTAPNSAVSPIYDPPIDYCPAIVLDTSNAQPGEDHGAGAEKWFFNVSVAAKFVLLDGSQTKAIRAFHELIRTVMRGWRTGTLDPLSTIGSAGYYLLQGDLTPEFARPQGGLLMGRAGFGLRFAFNENILG